MYDCFHQIGVPFNLRIPLVPGLNVRVEGFGDTEGSLLAEKVRFTKDELKIARTIYSQVVPVEERLSATEQELSRLQQQPLPFWGVVRGFS